MAGGKYEIPDIPDIPGLDDPPDSGGGRRRSRGGASRPRRWSWLLAGILLGVLATIFGPGLAAPYLPGFLRHSRVEVRGLVLEKKSEGKELLLTVDTPRGALLATFRSRVDQVGLLVSRGDSLTLGMGEFRPFVSDPEVLAVRKGPRAAEARSGGAGAARPGGTDRGPAATGAAAGSTAAVPESVPPAGGTDSADRSAPDSAS